MGKDKFIQKMRLDSDIYDTLKAEAARDGRTIIGMARRVLELRYSCGGCVYTDESVRVAPCKSCKRVDGKEENWRRRRE